MKRIGVAAIVLVVAAASVVRTYCVRTFETGAQLLWSADEAYLVVRTQELGWRFSALRAAGEFALGLLQSATPAEDVKPSTVMFRLTPGGMERHVFDSPEVGPEYVVFESRVRIGPRWQWTGSRFERTAPEEEERLYRTMPPLPTSSSERYGDYLNFHGWSSRHFLPMVSSPSGAKLPFQLGGQPAMLIVYSQASGRLDVDLQWRSQQPERVFSLDRRVRFINESAYSKIFSGPQP